MQLERNKVSRKENTVNPPVMRSLRYFKAEGARKEAGVQQLSAPARQERPANCCALGEQVMHTVRILRDKDGVIL